MEPRSVNDLHRKQKFGLGGHCRGSRIFGYKNMNLIILEQTVYAIFHENRLFVVEPRLTMASTYQSVILNKRPEEHIVLGETFSIIKAPVPSQDSLKEGEVIFRTNYVSVDPGMRDWLNEPGSYMAPVAIGEVMRGFSVGTISASKNSKFPVGSHATGLVGWTEMKVVDGNQLQNFEIPDGGKLADALSLLGKVLSEFIIIKSLADACSRLY
jgi:NADPH-dependent curcumin reductase CurA